MLGDAVQTESADTPPESPNDGKIIDLVPRIQEKQAQSEASPYERISQSVVESILRTQSGQILNKDFVNNRLSKDQKQDELNDKKNEIYERTQAKVDALLARIQQAESFCDQSLLEDNPYRVDVSQLSESDSEDDVEKSFQDLMEGRELSLKSGEMFSLEDVITRSTVLEALGFKLNDYNLPDEGEKTDLDPRRRTFTSRTAIQSSNPAFGNIVLEVFRTGVRDPQRTTYKAETLIVTKQKKAQIASADVPKTVAAD